MLKKITIKISVYFLFCLIPAGFPCCLTCYLFWKTVIRSEKVEVNTLLYAIVFFIARNDFIFALLSPEDSQSLMVAFPGSLELVGLTPPAEG